MVVQEASCKTRQVLTRIGSGECQSLQGCSDSQVWIMIKMVADEGGELLILQLGSILTGQL